VLITGGDIMANIKQQIKRIKTNEKRHLINASYKSSTKTAVKAVHQAVALKDKEKALVAVAYANKKLDKGQAKGIYHKNFVANHKSQLAKLVNTL